MPIAFLGIGAIFVIVAVRGTGREFLWLLQQDFIGPNNFLFWLMVIALIGMVGYVDELEPLANGFFVLMMLALLISHKGFFNQLQVQLRESQVA